MEAIEHHRGSTLARAPLRAFWCAALLAASGCFPRDQGSIKRLQEFQVAQPMGSAALGDPSVSPDGQYVAITATQGVRPVRYVVTPKRIERFPGPQDWWGERSDVVVIKADGTGERNLTARLTGAYRPSWSADGQSIYMTRRNGRHELFRLRVSDSELFPVSSAVTDDDQWVSLSRDGRSIVFDRRSLTADAPVSLFVASAEGAGQRALVQDGHGGRWSVDGQWILHQGTAGTWIVHPDGSGRRALDVPETATPLAWMPDGNAILYYARAASCPEGVLWFGDVDIRMIRLDGTRSKNVVPDIMNDTASDLAQLDPRCLWSSAGNQLVVAVNSGTTNEGLVLLSDNGVVTRRRVDNNRNGLVIVNATGDLVRDLRVPDSKHLYWGACWAPDGKEIWFRKEPLPGETTGGIYVVSSDGSGERQVVPDNVAWATSTTSDVGAVLRMTSGAPVATAQSPLAVPQPAAGK